MPSIEESKTTKTRKARPKSQTRFPKRFPSYVVAFSLKETYDDLVTAQQMICNKRSPQERSPQESNNSITPTNSLKMFDTEQADKLNQILDNNETEGTKNSAHNSSDSIESMTPTNSIKYMNSDNISNASIITIEEQENIVIDLSEDITIENAISQESDDVNTDTDKVEDVVEIYDENKKTCEWSDEITPNNISNSEELTDKTPKTEMFMETENRNGDTNEKSENVNQNKNSEPEAIFKATKNNRKYKKKKIPKRKSKKTVNIKQKTFKYKNPRRVINNRLEKYYEKRNLIDANQIQKELYSDEVSNVVSRTRVLHKIIAKENLREESEFILFINDVGLNEFDNESLSSSLSTAKKSIISNLSQSTLTQKSSKTSFKIDEENVETVNSVIKVPTENVPYKTDVINVAVAVAYNRSKVNTRDETIPVPSKEKFMILGSLTSSEMATPFISNLTSTSKLDFKAVTIETSNETLVNNKSSFGVSSNDFVIAQTSSDFTKSSDESNYTLKNNEETVIDIETVTVDHPVKENKPTLLDTVINLGIYPEMTPSTSSDTPYDYNNVIITENLNNKYPINSKGDNKDQEITKNILKKSINQQNEKTMNKTINLPNQAEINAMLKDNEMPQMKCAEESRHPSYMPPMWDRLVMTLDLAVKRLEDNLVEKIIKELKITLGCPLPKDTPISETKEKVGIFKVLSEEIKVDADQSLQCDLVKNTIIDQIMQKLSSDGPKIVNPRVAVKVLQKSQLFKDFEVLKPPEVSQITAEQGDTVTVSTVTYEVCKFCRLKTLFAGPINFVRENVFVITSVPTFFVVLLCVYGLILLLMKPW